MSMSNMLGQLQFIIYTFLFILNINKTSGIFENITKACRTNSSCKIGPQLVTFQTLEAYHENTISFQYLSPNFRGNFININVLSTNTLENNTFVNTYDGWVTALFLSEKNIVKLNDDAFHTLNCLYTLDLSNNRIGSITQDVLRGLPYLCQLNLRNNLIPHLSNSTFHNVTNLSELDLSYNKIRFIEFDTFQNLEYLYVLRLNNNKLNVLSLNIFKGAWRLKFLDLNNTELSDVTCHINATTVLPSLQVLNISHNNLRSELPLIAYPALSELHLEFNRLEHIDIRKLLKNCPSLQYLNIENNSIECTEMQTAQWELKSYGIKSSEIGKCPEDFEKVKYELRHYRFYLLRNMGLSLIFIIFICFILVLTIYLIAKRCCAIDISEPTTQDDEVEGEDEEVAAENEQILAEIPEEVADIVVEDLELQNI